MLVYVLQPPLSGCQHYLQFVQLDMIFWALYEFHPISSTEKRRLFGGTVNNLNCSARKLKVSSCSSSHPRDFIVSARKALFDIISGTGATL